MKPFASFAALGLALAACAPLSIYHRPGVEVSRMQRDLTNCQVRALRDAPVASQIRQRPPVFVPARQVCRKKKCTTRPGYWVQGDIYTVDVNAGLRGRVEGQCMAQKGYRPVDVPLCDGALRSAIAPAQTRILPQLSESTCAIRYQDGTWQIVNSTGKP